MGKGQIISLRELAINGAVSLAIIAAVFYFIGIDQIISEFARLNPFYLFMSVVFLLLMYVGMTERIRLVLSKLGVRTKFWDVFKIHVMGMLLADFTPARTGYLAVAYGLTKKLKVPGEKSTVAVIGPQIYDFILKAVVGTAAIIYLLNTFFHVEHGEILFLGAAAMFGMIAVMALLLFSKRFLALFSVFRKFPLAGKLLSIFEGAQANAPVIINEFPKLLFLLTFTWSMKAFSWYMVGKALGINLQTGFPEVLFYYFLQPLLTLLEFIPTPTLAGLGLSEGGGVLVFSAFGIGAAKAASFVFLARVKTIIINLPGIPEALSVVESDGEEEKKV